MQDNNFHKMSEMANTDINDVHTLNILICYLLYKIDKPVEKDQLYEIAISTEIINYFLYQDSIDYLLNNNSITIETNENGAECYVLAAKGVICAKQLKKFVSKSHRDKLVLAALKYFARLKQEQEVIIDYIKIEQGGYYTHIRCLDLKSDLMDLKLFAPDLTQAKMLGEKVRLNPAGFYGKLIDLALNNVAEEFDLSDI